MRWDIWKIFFQTIEAIFPQGMSFTKVVKAKIGIYKKHKFLDPFFCEKHPIKKFQPLDHSALSTLVSNSLTSCLVDLSLDWLDSGWWESLNASWWSNLGNITLEICNDCQCLFKILTVNFGHNFEAEVWWRLWGWNLVEIFRLNFDQLMTEKQLWRVLKPWVHSALGNVCHYYHRQVI